MLYNGPFGRTLVPPEFNEQCLEMKVECRVQPFPNPGNPFQSMRLLIFRNFNNGFVTVYQHDKKQQIHILQPKGELQIMLAVSEELPTVKKGLPNENV